MAEGVINGTEGHEALGSAGRELDGVPLTATVTLEWQALQNIKYIQGYQAWFLPTCYDATAPDPVDYWLPSVTWRTNFRKFYANLAVDVTTQFYPVGDDPIEYTYTCTGSLSGSGNCPAQSGMPDYYENYTPPIGAVGSESAGTPLACKAVVADGIAWGASGQNVWPPSLYFGAEIAGYVSGQSWTASTFSGFPEGDYVFDGSSYLYGQSFEFTLSNARAFADILDVAENRINTLSFSTFAAYEVTAEEFDEYKGGSLTPGDYDGLPYSLTQAIHYPPYFGANPVYYENQFCWTGWYMETDEEAAAFNRFSCVTDNKIYCARSRFRINAAKDYFIAEATVLRNPSMVSWNPTSWDLKDWIADVVVISSGTTVSGTVYDIGWPTGTGATDFVTSHFPVEDVDTLSIGKIRFAILGETPAQWSTRTGISYT